MPYALIPDGYTLKKVTKLQKQAVSSKRRHDNITALMANPNTPPVVGGAALLVVAPILTKLLWDAVENEIGNIFTPEQKMKVEKSFRFALVTNPATAPLVLGAEGLKLLGGAEDFFRERYGLDKE